MINSKLSCSKLSACSLAVAMGLTNGLGLMILAWSSWQWGFGGGMVTIISSVYHGYDASLMGGLFGLGWGFIDGFIFGLLVGWIYNLCLCCCCRKNDSMS